MGIPTTKAELLHAINSDYNHLITDFRRISDNMVICLEIEGHVKNSKINTLNLCA